jgi:hypothetical protein
MFVFDLPFLFICGLILGNLTRTQQIAPRINWYCSILLLFIFQAGGIMLWFNVFPGSKEFMILPFNLIGLTTIDFEPYLSAILFALEPPLLILGELIGLTQRSIKET